MPATVTEWTPEDFVSTGTTTPATTKERAAWSLLSDLTRGNREGSPHDRAPIAEWVARFREVGFFSAVEYGALTFGGRARWLRTIDFTDSRPRAAVTLFRAAVPGGQERVHWTPSPADAALFAGRREGAHLWAIHAPPESILAVAYTQGIAEWVIDPRGHELVDLGPAAVARRVRPAGTLTLRWE